MEIYALGFNAGPGSDASGVYNDLTILMGTTSLESLTDTFDNNWAEPGVQVMNQASYEITGVVPGEWFVFDLDDPYTYDGSSNLLIELTWQGPAAAPGTGSVYTWYWVTSGNRVLSATDPSASTGFASPYCNHIRLDYDPLHLEAMTFAGIKASF